MNKDKYIAKLETELLFAQKMCRVNEDLAALEERAIEDATGSIMDVIETHIPEYAIDSAKFELADIWLLKCVETMADAETWADLDLDRQQRQHYSAVRDLCEAYIREFDRTKSEIPSIMQEALAELREKNT
jgi:hypothetical protein